jgi:hypothetical protein
MTLAATLTIAAVWTVRAADHSARATRERPDVVVALAGPDGCTSSGEFSDGPIPAVISNPTGEPNLDLEHGSLRSGTLCVKNVGRTAGRLTVSFTDVADLEVGRCGTSEASSGDVTCAAADDGELTEVVDVSIDAVGSYESKSCRSVSKPFERLAGPGVGIDPQLEPGSTCAFRFALTGERKPRADALTRAQTDEVTWSIVFSLSA